MRNQLNRLSNPGLVVAAFALMGLVGATPAAGQQVRILKDETNIRLDPSETSAVMTTLQAGTVLDWVSDAGGWYAVSLPGLPGEEALIGYVLVGDVEFVSGAASTGDSEAGMTIPELQQQYENERQRRSSGLKKVIWGAVVIGASHAALAYVPWLQEPDQEEHDDETYQNLLDRREAAETGRSVGTGLGAALGVWGLGQFAYGWRKMRSLELELPRAAAASIEEQYAEAVESRQSGRRKLFWGVFFVGASYAVVEWVPYFSVPVREDFENDEDYEAAQDRRDKAETGRTWGMVFGAGLTTWGTGQWILASRKMAEIEATARVSALSVPLRTSPGSTLAPALFVSRFGGRTQVGITMAPPGFLP